MKSAQLTANNFRRKGKVLRLGVIFSTFLFALSVLPHEAVFAQSPTQAPQGRVSPNPLRSGPTPIVPGDAPTTGINLTLSPVFLNLSTDPGKAVTSSLRVTNNNNSTEYLEITLVRFVPQATGNPVIADVKPDDPFRQWISYSEPQFTIAPNETKTIRVTVNPPEDTALGYYYALVVSRIKEVEAGNQQSVVAGSPAVPLLLEVRSANAKREMQLVDFKADKMVYEYLPATFVIKAKNSGNIHLSPFGDVFIDGNGKKNIAVLHVNEGRGNILPNSERIFEASWDDGLIVRVPKVVDGKEVKDAKGKTVYETKIDWEKPLSKFRFGKYTANLLLVYDDGQNDVPVNATVSFWVIPWKAILAVLAIIILPIVLLRFLRRTKKKKS